MSMALMTKRRFAPLFLCQFFAAFGDNFLKTALVFVILFEVSGTNSGVLITLAGATLIAPFFFLSGLGGELADRYDKALVAQRIKLTEIGAAVIAVAGFAFHSLTLLFVAVGLFGTLASLFGPIKYGILPDHARPQGIAVRQCTDRRRHVPRHSARHHRRGHCRQRQQQSDPFRVADDPHRAGELGVEPPDSAEPARAIPTSSSTAISSSRPAR